jgi:hypothetical protein
MSILSLAVQHLLACGASPEAVAKFVEEVEASREEVEAAAEAAEAETRAKRAEYMREYRRNSHVRSRNSYAPSSPPMINNSTSSPTSDLAKAKSSKPSLKANLSDDFEVWWGAYPRREGKRAALKAYTHAIKRGATADELYAGARRYAAQPKREKEFTKMPATWLNADCHLDEIAPRERTVVSGPWKPIEPEKMPEPISPAELAKRQEQIRRAKEALCKKP